MSLGIDFISELCAMHRQPATFEPNPTAVYMTQVATELAREKESYLLKAFEKVGINPNVVIEQDALITELKAKLDAVVELTRIDAIEIATSHDPDYYSGWDMAMGTIREAVEKELKTKELEPCKYCPTLHFLGNRTCTCNCHATIEKELG